MTIANAVRNFFENMRKGDREVHSLVIYKDGKKIFSDAPAPYSVHQKNHVYSLSKSFCSTALGIACDKGYLSLDDRIIDIFPEKCPSEISENLSAMTLRNVLSMNTGHDGCVMNRMVTSDDPVAAFLATDIPHKPGTHFAYNTGATYLASACLTKKTGMSVLDFLEFHLFRHLGICGSKWLSHKGISEGGVGFHVCCEDAAKLGLLYLGGGIYDGKHLLSEEYVREACSPLSDNKGNGTPDWCAGYGLQFWRNAREGYRGDGAFGQVCAVFPERNTVIALIAECGDMQPEIDDIYTLLDELESCGEPVANAEQELDEFLGGFYVPDEFSAQDCELVGKTYAFDSNRSDFSLIHFEKCGDGIEVAITARDTNINSIKLIPEKWTHGVLRGNNIKPTLEALTSTFDDDMEYQASAKLEGEKLIVTLRALNCPHRVTYAFERNGEVLSVVRRANKCGGYAETFTAKEIIL